MKKILLCLTVLSFILTACGRDEKPAAEPEQPATPVTSLEESDTSSFEEVLPSNTSEEPVALPEEESTEPPVEEIKTEPEVQPEPLPQDPILQVVQTLNTLESSLQRYVAQKGSCKGATIDKLDVDVSLPGYQLSINDKVCVIKAISQQKDTLGTKFSTQLGEHKVYCTSGKSDLCDRATKKGIIKMKTAECVVSLRVGGYRIGDIFKDKGFEGQKLTKRGNSVMTIYEAGERWDGSLTVIVDSKTKRIVALQKKLPQVPLYAVIRAVEKQGNIKLKKRYSLGKVIGAEGKICGKYDIGVAPRSGEYDWEADGGIVTIDVVDKKQMIKLDSKMDDLAAKNVLL